MPSRVSIGRLEEALKIFLIYSEEDVLDAASIEIARNEALLAESLDDGFVSNLTALAVKCEMFHFKKKLKCVTQSGKPGPDPIAPKPLRGFNYAGAKIDKKDYSTKFVSLFQDRVL